MIDPLASMRVGGNIVSTPEAPFYPEGIDTRPRAPQDEETGVPLLIAPGPMDKRNKHNKHHSYFPHKHPIFQTLGGQALQTAHIEDVDVELHNHDEGKGTAYHSQIGDGPVIPDSEEEQIGVCALLMADYLPEEIVDTQKGELWIRGSFGWEIDYLRRGGIVATDQSKSAGTVATPPLLVASLNEGQTGEQRPSTFLGSDGGIITLFFREFVFKQDLTQTDRTLRKKFLATSDELAGVRILGQLSALASEVATVKGRPLNDVYRRMLQRGRLGTLAPLTAPDCILNSVGSNRGLRKQLPRLSRALIQLEEAAA